MIDDDSGLARQSPAPDPVRHRRCRPAQGRGRAGGGRSGSTRTCASGRRAERLTAANAAALLAGADVVIDGSDNFATRLVVSDTCTAARIPLVSAAIGQFQVQVGTWRGWEPDRPCYRCFVGDAFDSEDCDSCAELGVLGAMAGIAGSWAALEAIRQIVGFGGEAAGKLHIFDGLAPAMRTLRIVKDPACRSLRGSGGELTERVAQLKQGEERTARCRAPGRSRAPAAAARRAGGGR